VPGEQQRTRDRADGAERFAIVIPTRRRAAQLARCLDAVRGLDYPRHRFQVIVVLDGPDADAESVLARFTDTVPLEVVHQTHGGPAAARNRGAEVAAADYLAFTDDDCMPAADWLDQLDRRFRDDPDALVGGRTENAETGNLFSVASQIVVDAVYAYYNANSRHGFFTTTNLAVSTERFRALGGFDPVFPFAAAEDREFSDRWREQGDRLIYEPEIGRASCRERV